MLTNFLSLTEFRYDRQANFKIDVQMSDPQYPCGVLVALPWNILFWFFSSLGLIMLSDWLLEFLPGFLCTVLSVGANGAQINGMMLEHLVRSLVPRE